MRVILWVKMKHTLKIRIRANVQYCKIFATVSLILSYFMFINYFFPLGLYNVMISTDVVQAGLDIPQCSLVIRYDVS